MGETFPKDPLTDRSILEYAGRGVLRNTETRHTVFMEWPHHSKEMRAVTISKLLLIAQDVGMSIRHVDSWPAPAQYLAQLVLRDLLPWKCV